TNCFAKLAVLTLQSFYLQQTASLLSFLIAQVIIYCSLQMNNSNESEILEYFEGWDQALNSESLSLLSLLEFRKKKDSFTFDKCVEHNIIIKFLANLASTADKEWRQAAFLLKNELKRWQVVRIRKRSDNSSMQPPKQPDNSFGWYVRTPPKQVQQQAVKSFWQNVELEKIDMNMLLMNKKMEEAMVKFDLDQSLTGNKAQEVLNNSKLEHLKRKMSPPPQAKRRILDDTESDHENNRDIGDGTSLARFNHEVSNTQTWCLPKNNSPLGQQIIALTHVYHLLTNKRGKRTLYNVVQIPKPPQFNPIYSDNEETEGEDEDDYGGGGDYDGEHYDENVLTRSKLDVCNTKTWRLPSNTFVDDIFNRNVSKNAETMKHKGKPTAIQKVFLRYGASRIIDLSAHMREWFSIEERQYMIKDHAAIVEIRKLPSEVDAFIANVENMVHRGDINPAYKLSVESHANSSPHSCFNKITKVYSELTKEGNDILESGEHGHTEIDVILKACSYIIDGLNKACGVYQKWGESSCPLTKSANYTKGRKCDVRNLSTSEVDLGEWEFAVNATPTKTITDRCRSARINQTILNGLMNLVVKNEHIEVMKVPYMQFAGTSGQMLVEVRINGFYVVIPGPKIELPKKLSQIAKLKPAVMTIKHILDMYDEMNRFLNDLEVGKSHAFDDIFKINEPSTNNSACDPWWTPKNARKTQTKS
ncbi:9337_t:CDS:10, partial [Ambispora leptoticha]